MGGLLRVLGHEPGGLGIGLREGRLWVISGHWRGDQAMSALPPKADMLIVGIDVCYVPIADITPTSVLASAMCHQQI